MNTQRVWPPVHSIRQLVNDAQKDVQTVQSSLVARASTLNHHTPYFQQRLSSAFSNAFERPRAQREEQHEVEMAGILATCEAHFQETITRAAAEWRGADAEKREQLKDVHAVDIVNAVKSARELERQRLKKVHATLVEDAVSVERRVRTNALRAAEVRHNVERDVLVASVRQLEARGSLQHPMQQTRHPLPTLEQRELPREGSRVSVMFDEAAGQGVWFGGQVTDRRLEDGGGAGAGRKMEMRCRVKFDDGEDKWIHPALQPVLYDWQKKTQALLTVSTQHQARTSRPAPRSDRRAAQPSCVALSTAVGASQAVSVGSGRSPAVRSSGAVQRTSLHTRQQELLGLVSAHEWEHAARLFAFRQYCEVRRERACSGKATSKVWRIRVSRMELCSDVLSAFSSLLTKKASMAQALLFTPTAVTFVDQWGQPEDGDDEGGLTSEMASGLLSPRMARVYRLHPPHIWQTSQPLPTYESLPSPRTVLRFLARSGPPGAWLLRERELWSHCAAVFRCRRRGVGGYRTGDGKVRTRRAPNWRRPMLGGV